MVLFHIMGDIRNMDGDLISFSESLDLDGIVKIVGIVSVDGDDDLVPEIMSSGKFFFPDFLRYPSRFVQNGFGERDRSIVFGDDLGDVSSGFVCSDKDLVDSDFDGV